MTPPADRTASTARVFDIAIRLGLVFLLAAWCFRIVQPFLILILWATVIAVAVYPAYRKLAAGLGGRRKLAAGLATAVALSLLLVPAVWIAASLADTTRDLAAAAQQGELRVSPPAPGVRDWPLIGDQVFNLWSSASKSLSKTIADHKEEAVALGQYLLGLATGAVSAIVQSVLAILVAGFLLAAGEPASELSLRLFRRLADDRLGAQLHGLAVASIRSVAQGVVGVALIQAVLGAVGMAAMDVPGWGLWTLCILVLAIAQLPAILVLGPVVAYVFSVADTTPAVLFAVWSGVVGLSDNILKPLFLGRGTATPMPVILVGSIGGMITAGILGLFLGAIILALGYELFVLWMGDAGGTGDGADLETV